MSMQARNTAHRALSIQRTLGTARAASYLRDRLVSFEEALFILCGR